MTDGASPCVPGATWPRSAVRCVAAPLVDQSDAAFRLLCMRYGATMTFTQMYLAADLVAPDSRLLQCVRAELEVVRQLYAEEQCSKVQEEQEREDQEPGCLLPESGVAAGCPPQVVQLAGDDPLQLRRSAAALADMADGFDLNLGCPQRRAREGHYGAYLLGAHDWPLIEELVRALCTGAAEVKRGDGSPVPPRPVSVKLRLCEPAEWTPELAVRLARAGAGMVTLHARFASASRRRHGPARLEVVRAVAEAVREGVPERPVRVVSNGNVRTHADIAANLATTGADGAMVGEHLLEDPSLFSGADVPAPKLASEYLALVARVERHARGAHEAVALAPALQHVKQHLLYMLDTDRFLPRGKERSLLVQAIKAAPDRAALESLVDGMNAGETREIGYRREQ